MTYLYSNTKCVHVDILKRKMIPIIMSENGFKNYFRTFGIILFYLNKI